MLSTLRVITRLSLQPRHQASLQIRTLASIPTIATKSSQDLSNRQKFKQLQPPLKLYEKLERLGFGTLLKTKRFSGLHKQKERKDQQKLKHTTRVGPPPEPKYSFPLLSFFAGAKTSKSIPAESLDEIAFVGRSNVGKSSLLNTLSESAIARTSDKPGLTQQLNFFNAGKLFHMVDMPGYGFAFAEEEDRLQWKDLMETYITTRKTLKRVYVVIDARHGIKVADTEFLKMLNTKQVKFQIVLTKSDLLVLPNLARRILTVENDINQYRNAIKDVVVVSSKTGCGINQLRKEVLFLVNNLKPKTFYEQVEQEKAEKHAKYLKNNK